MKIFMAILAAMIGLYLLIGLAIHALMAWSAGDAVFDGHVVRDMLGWPGWFRS